MAFNNTNQNKERGYTANQNSNPRGNTPGNQNRGRIRLRDRERMAQYNERKQTEWYGATNRANQVRIAEEYSEAQFRPVNPPSRSENNRRPNPRGPPPAPVTKTESAPSDELLYTGPGKGSKPVKKTLGHNIDF